jgi:hypothetical protein
MADAAACFISSSNYDTSCTVDSDCIPAQFGNYCVSQCFCGGGAINKDSGAQYAEDRARTPLGSGTIAPGLCGCPVSFGPCCSQGQCTTACSGRPSADTGTVDSGVDDGSSGG